MNNTQDLAIFQQEMEGLDLEGTFTQRSDDVIIMSDSKNLEIKDPHDTFVEAQHRFIVEKKLNSRDTNVTRFELKTENSTHVAILELYDQWSRKTKLEKGMLINIVDVDLVRTDSYDTFIVSRAKGFVIVEPDILVSITSVMGQMWCERKSSLSEFFKFPFESEVMLRGTIAHDLIGRALVDKVTDQRQLQELGKNCLSSPSIMNNAYSCKLSQEQLVTMANELLPSIKSFIKGRVLSQAKDQRVKILSVCDIEDTYWNPVFGLKGKLDATVKIQNKNKKEIIVPLEFKTGRDGNKEKNPMRHEHLGQVCLYTLLMRPRYGLNDEGLLLYIREEFLKECTVSFTDLQSLIMLRNSLAQSTITANGELCNIPSPGGVDFSFKCERCELKNVCALLFREPHVGFPEFCTDTELKLFQSINHLYEQEISFFHRWMKIITLEIEEHNRTINTMNLWKTKAESREKHGQCISNLEFVFMSPIEVYDSSGNRCYKLTLKKSDGKSMAKTLLTEKDFIVLSTQSELCISYGSIETIDDNRITLTVERKLNDVSSEAGTRFIIDKVVSHKVLQMQYNNLSLLMEPTLKAKRLREYIIAGSAHDVKKNLPIYSTLKAKKVQEYQKVLFRYNDDQRRAILKAVATDSFLLVKGMPGTGKTETIVGLLQLLSDQQCTVLVVAYTNNALDNILLKYNKQCLDAKKDPDFLRVGSPSKLSPESLREFSTASMTKCGNVDMLAQQYNRKKIVGCTLMSLQHEIFRVRKNFDYCIVDEASQALPTCVFGALMLAEKFVLFGDPDQLPAIIKSPMVKKMRVENNMFDLIGDSANTVKLSIQYRMNSEIMKLANKLVYYNDEMICADEVQSEQFLNIPSLTLKKHVTSIKSLKVQAWMKNVLSKKLTKSVLFLETSTWNALEEKIGESVRNIHEANIVRQCVDSFVTCGYPARNIGVIAPFRGQVAYIRQLFQSEDMSKYRDVEVSTVDQYQGRDKHIIICSFTKSKSISSRTSFLHTKDNLGCEEPELKASILEDLRRLNVAITRAKVKLIMIGNRNTLEQFEPFKKLFPFLTVNQLISVINS